MITMSDVRKAKMCSNGARAFFVRHSLDWSRFLKEGISEEELKKTGDAMALKVIEVANGR